jgi:hypothetical protein
MGRGGGLGAGAGVGRHRAEAALQLRMRPERLPSLPSGPRLWHRCQHPGRRSGWLSRREWGGGEGVGGPADVTAALHRAARSFSGPERGACPEHERCRSSRRSGSIQHHTGPRMKPSAHAQAPECTARSVPAQRSRCAAIPGLTLGCTRYKSFCAAGGAATRPRGLLPGRPWQTRVHVEGGEGWHILYIW